ncbi:helicase RepA family protein [Wolbachia endosymbiont (group B) of Melanostoma mellinum]|uniref:helicase RepA family protein n=1 Tax=Wolbachia endosymbiont (group B) of Melanostoma mellinum TaxID=2954030 RepID=UPI0022320DAF|nr:helicase RepA family protein [Wolbachia endosymbiont (group B) of Melanostoma mellinum]
MKYDEEKLWIAVIERAIKDAAGKNPELKKEAIRWFDSESFETVCELANLSSKRMKSMYGGFMHRKEIKGLLIDNIKECVPYLIPNGNFYRERTYVGNCDGDMITVKIVGKEAGNWRNFTKGTSGDIIDLWTLVKGDINSAKKWLNTKENTTEHKVTSFSARHYLNDKSPMPKDIIGPRILTPGGLLVIGGTPKIGKSNFLLSLLAHMASGVPFLNMKSPRPLKIFCLQNEMEYGDMKERLLQLKIDQNLWKENLFITNKMPLTLNSEEVRAIITEKLDAKTVDLIVIDSFLDYREIISFVRSDMEKLRSITNPMAGIVLTHCTKKVSSTVLEKNPFQALSGSNILRSVYTSGIVIFKPNERTNTLKVVYELRNSKPMTKYIRKVNGCWKTSKVIATA